ncbi:MAG TPA: VOC family protein [Burkholderiales bacterium]|nr:VOC family protein [Burkholderiales bacterium]
MSFTRIDHVMIAVPELDQGIDTYVRLGFNVQPGGEHPGMGTHNAIAFNEEDYLELIAIRDRGEYALTERWSGLVELAERGGGLRYLIVQSDDLAADVAAMRARDVEVGYVAEGSRRTPSGGDRRWKAAMLGPRHPLPVFFIQHITPLAERRPAGAGHPNGVYRTERAYIAVADLAAAVDTYSRVLGMAKPPITRGTVIMAEMAVFQLGTSALTLAHPYAPGPCADALARRGPGPFQVLYRTKSMDAAARWLTEHGVPPPACGTRNTGEQAMLVPPEHACGVYIGFVGTA